MPTTSKKKSGLFKKGPDSRRGRGPEPGAPNAGRPKKTFLERMQALSEDERTIRRLEAALDHDDPHVFLKAWADVANRGFGRATETVQVQQSGGLVIRIVKE